MVWTTWEVRPWQHRELATVAAEAGLSEQIELVIAGDESTQAEHRGLVNTALDRLVDRGVQLTALFIFEEEGRSARVQASLARCAKVADLTFVVRPWLAVTRGEVALTSLSAPFTVQIVTDVRVAERGIYPALDVRHSGRRDLNGVELRHAVQAALEGEHAVGEQLLAYLSQPFHVVEHVTGLAAGDVSVLCAESDVDRIIAGETATRYGGALPSRRPDGPAL